MTDSVTASSTRTVATRRARSECARAGVFTPAYSFSCRTGFEHVARAAHGMDHGCPACVDLLAQVGDVELDDVGLPAEVVVPHPVQDLGLGQHPLRVAHQEAQQLELG